MPAGENAAKSSSSQIASVDAPASPASSTVLHQNREAAPWWTVRYGEEFWRRPEASNLRQDSFAMPASINLGDVIERVSHPISQAAGAPFPHASARNYTATFDGEGFRLAPRAVGGDPAPADLGAGLSPGKANHANEVTFRTLSVQSGEDTLYAKGTAQVDWSFLGNTAQGLLNESKGLIEHYETRAQGVEVTWVMNDRPATPGPLVIEAELGGVGYVGASGTSHIFATTTGAFRVRVGAATLVDAMGVRTEVPLSIANERIHIQIPENIINGAAFPLAIDPTVGPELGFGVAECHAQFSPAIAWNGTNYLVVWSDNRDGSNGADVYGTRVSSAAEVLDPSGIPISTNSQLEAFPGIASNGSDYLVVWSVDSRTGSGVDIHGIRVSGSGTLLGGDIAISTAANTQQFPRAASNGTNYLVVWNDSRTDPTESAIDVYGARVSSSGTVLDATGILICNATDSQGFEALNDSPQVASNGADYLVAWEDARRSFYSYDVYAARVTSAGSVSDANGFLLKTNSFKPTVAGKQAGYLVAWSDGNSSPSPIYGSRISNAGIVQDTNGIPINTDSASKAIGNVACNGTNFLVTWSVSLGTGYGEYIRGARVTSGGVVSDTNGLDINLTGNSYNAPAVASNGSDYLVAWQDGMSEYADPSNDINGSRVTSGGQVLDKFPISTGVPNGDGQITPAVACAGSEFLVVWDDFRNGVDHDIYGARINSSGGVLDPCGIAICTTNHDQQHPAVASDGGNYLVVWDDKRSGSYDLYGARINNGVVADANGFAISATTNSETLPAVANMGTNYLVVWQNISTANSANIYGARVTTGGQVSDPNGIPISTAVSNQINVAVTANGSNYLVVWQDYRNGSAPDIYGTLVSSTGSVTSSNGVAISTATGNQANPGVASNGTNFLVVWGDTRNTGVDVYGSRVTSGGIVSDTNGIAICTLTNSQGFPRVASIGADYLVVW